MSKTLKFQLSLLEIYTEWTSTVLHKKKVDHVIYIRMNIMEPSQHRIDIKNTKVKWVRSTRCCDPTKGTPKKRFYRPSHLEFTYLMSHFIEAHRVRLGKKKGKYIGRKHPFLSKLFEP